ncbi:MAG: hypothetical protein ACFCVD_12015 [Nodosilinea sp.]
MLCICADAKGATLAWVALADRMAALLQNLPVDRQQQVLNFARSRY